MTTNTMLLSLIAEILERARILRASMLDDLSRNATTYYVTDMRDYDAMLADAATLRSRLT